MKPIKKKRTGRVIPDLTPEEIQESQIGGTDSETAGEEGPAQSTEGDEGGGGYGRPLEQGDDDQPA